MRIFIFWLEIMLICIQKNERMKMMMSKVKDNKLDLNCFMGGLVNIDLSGLSEAHCFLTRFVADGLEFNTRIRISEKFNTDLRRPVTDERCGHYLDDVGPIGKRLALKVMGIEGLTFMQLYPYDFRLIKAKSFSWDELMPKIADAIREALDIKILIIQHLEDK
jgi:hypothetical protein